MKNSGVAGDAKGATGSGVYCCGSNKPCDFLTKFTEDHVDGSKDSCLLDQESVVTKRWSMRRRLVAGDVGW